MKILVPVLIEKKIHYKPVEVMKEFTLTLPSGYVYRCAVHPSLMEPGKYDACEWETGFMLSMKSQVEVDWAATNAATWLKLRVEKYGEAAVKGMIDTVRMDSGVNGPDGYEKDHGL